MFKRIFTIGAFAAAFIGAANAAPVTPDQALARVSGDARLRTQVKAERNAKLAYILNDDMKEAVAYVFNKPGDAGFMILSADDMAYPVLGYTDSGSFNEDEIPEPVMYWLEEYGRQIEYAKTYAGSARFDVKQRASKSEWKTISPLLKTKWDQGAPYNNSCPTIGNKPCYTGCVATSMAQVMKYFNYPERGQGKIYNLVDNRRYEINLADKAFDWENMLDNYTAGSYNDTQAAAVAYLMEACGFAVDMNYGLDASGSQSQKIAPALKNYFLYDGNISFEARISYSASEWEEKVYNDLAEGLPVIYNGNDSSIGHSFVCDGYDGNGYFHFNWGWGGMSDGYFTLNALNPEALGIGGGEGGGFNFLQGCVFGIRKPTGIPSVDGHANITLYGLLGVDQIGKDGAGRTTVTLGLKSGYGTLYGWRNESMYELNVNFGAILQKEGSEEITAIASGKFGNMNNVNLPSGALYGSNAKAVIPLPATLPDGKYKMTLCTKPTVSADGWEPVVVPYSYPDYVYITKTNGVVTSEDVDKPALTLSDVRIDGNLYYGRYVRMNAKISNPSEYELTEAVSVGLLDKTGTQKFKSANVLMTIPAGETVEKSWMVALIPQDGQRPVTEETEFTLIVTNDFTDELYGTFGTVSMRPNPGDPTVQLRGMTIADAETQQVDILGQTFNILKVKDKNNFTLSIKFRVSKGYFDSNVYVGIDCLAPNAISPNQTVSVIDQIYSQNIELATGEEITIDVPVSLPEADDNQIYYAKCRYYTSKSEKVIGSLRFCTGDPSGVVEIIGDDEAGAEYFNLRGVRIGEPVPGEPVIEKRGNSVRKIMN